VGVMALLLLLLLLFLLFLLLLRLLVVLLLLPRSILALCVVVGADRRGVLRCVFCVCLCLWYGKGRADELLARQAL